MRINKQALQKLCAGRGLRLKELLEKSGVSKTAYYHLVYKSRLLPGSLYDIAGALGVRPSAFLEEEGLEEKKMIKILQTTEAIMKKHPALDRDNVRHTLILLNETPLERLRRGLTRGRNRYSYR